MAIEPVPALRIDVPGSTATVRVCYGIFRTTATRIWNLEGVQALLASLSPQPRHGEGCKSASGLDWALLQFPVACCAYCGACGG